MGQNLKKIGKGILWGLGGTLSAVLAAAVGWIVYSRKYIRHNLQMPQALDAERKEFDSHNAGRLSYYVDSSGRGTPLVLLHSINAAPSAYEHQPIFEHFRGKRPVYALDLPGFGFSERADRVYTPLLFQRVVTEFIRDVVGSPADVVGLSLSCEFAALSAVHNPENIRSLVMISPTGFQPPRTEALPERARHRDAKDMAYSTLSVGLWNRPFFDLVASRPSIRYFLNMSFEGLVPDRLVDYAYQTSHQPGAQYAPTYFLSGKLFTPAVRETVYHVLNCPVLVLYDRDPYTNFEMLPGVVRERETWQAERITPTKGLPHWERPEKTFSAMESFWQGL